MCASGYGRGVADACHPCTASFKGGMYFVVAVTALLTLIIVVLLAVYLVRKTPDEESVERYTSTRFVP